jgi:hypothetical protein
MLKTLAVILALAAPGCATADTYLLMAEESGCAWCAKWNAELGDIYPKTPEGRAAPLHRHDVRDGTTEADLTRRIHFTPTFILVHEGREVGRIEGYPGEDFFWGLLGSLFEKAGIPLAEAG